jgi:quinoprotein glucose dehydrogenase
VMAKLAPEKTTTVLSGLLEKMKNGKLSPDLLLELKEAVKANGASALTAQLAALQPGQSLLDEYTEALHGGDIGAGRDLFWYNGRAQCTRCHAIGEQGSTVGPNLKGIGKTLNRTQLLEALINPGTRIAPGYGNVAITLKEGQTIYGILTKETPETVTLTTSAAEPVHIAVARIASRQNLPSGMPEMTGQLSKREIRDLVAFLTTL